jgi:hypothetical protein
MKRLSWLLLASFIISLAAPYYADAHPGRTDAQGGHNVRTAGWGYPVGSYHYHNGGPSKSKPKDTVDIRKVQERLNELGYDCGPADGVKGPQTEEAIKQFQRDKGLEADGIVGQKTKNALGL